MKRILLSVLALSLVLSGSAFATVRTNGMAIDQDDTNDYGNIYAFPQLTGKYANILSVVPTGSSWDANGELLINLGDKTITLGYAAGDTNFLGGSYDWSNISGNAGFGGTDPDQKLQLGFAMPMGSGLIGLRFSWSRYGYNNTWKQTDDAALYGDDYEYTDKSGQIKIEAGYGMEDAGPFKSVDLGAKIAFGSGEVLEEDRDTDNDPNTTEAAEREGTNMDGATDIAIRLRAVKEQGDGSIVVNVGFQTSTLNGEYFYQWDNDGDGSYQTTGAVGDDDETYRIEMKKTDISVGVAYNKPINDGGLLVIAARLSTSSQTTNESETWYNDAADEVWSGLTDYEEKESWLELPLSVGVEDKLSDSLKGRLGIKKNLLNNYKYGYVDGTDYDAVSDSLLDKNEYEYSYNPDREDATLFIGLSATKGKFYSDWVIEHDLFWNGPNFLFGNSSDFAAEWEVGLTF